MLFGIGKSSFLGIDFGTSSIKAVEISQKEKRPVLVNFGEVPLKTGLKKADGTYYSTDEVTSLSLRALMERMKPTTTEACVALPAFTGLVALIEMPEMSEKELDQAIKFEAHKYIPSSLDDVNLSWDMVRHLEASEGQPARFEVLLVAALKKDVARHATYIETAGLSMKLLELETFSLVRAIAGDTKGTHLLIDIGARTTNLVLVQDGSVKMSRNIDAGGSDLTRTIMESLEITAERAEAMKKSDKDLLNTPESALVFPALQAIATEVSRILGIYKAKQPDQSIESIILSGGTARMMGLAKFYEKTLGMTVTIADPWQAIEKPGTASLVPDDSYTIAMGLALGALESQNPEKKVIKKKVTLKELLNKKI